MVEWYEAAFDRLYPVMYPHRDSAEARIAVSTFVDMFAEREPVLDLACGEGRYLKVLVDEGIDAYGVDLSHFLLSNAAQVEDLTGRLIQADMRRLPFADGTFGGVINMFTSFGYFSTDTDNLRVFSEVARVLCASGRFLFDFINSGRVSAGLEPETRRESAGYEIHERRNIEQHGKYLLKRATVTNMSSGHTDVIEERLRLYTRDEVMHMMNSVGMTIDGEYGDYHGNPYAPGVSERLIVVSTKA